MSKTIIFDLDGTVALGHGPVMAYANAIARDCDSVPHDFVSRVEKLLDLLDTGTSQFRDGYHVVAEQAERWGVSQVAMQKAYLESRTHIGTELEPLEAPEKFQEILEKLSPNAALILATNAPAVGIHDLFDRWGVSGYFAEILVNVGKPAGLYPIISKFLRRGPVLSIGDIVENDLLPAMELGAETALVGANAHTAAEPVTMRGATITDLLPELMNWVTNDDGPSRMSDSPRDMRPEQ